MVGDGSYLMMNSEIATSVMLGAEADHRRARQPRLRLHQPPAARDRRRELQQPVRATPATRRCRRSTSSPMPRASARMAEKVASIAELEAALRARPRRATAPASSSSTPIRIAATEAGGAWWDVAVPEVSERAEVRGAPARPMTSRAESAASRRLSMIRFGVSPIAWSTTTCPSSAATRRSRPASRRPSEIGFEGIELGRQVPARRRRR